MSEPTREERVLFKGDGLLVTTRRVVIDEETYSPRHFQAVRLRKQVENVLEKKQNPFLIAGVGACGLVFLVGAFLWRPLVEAALELRPSPVENRLQVLLGLAMSGLAGLMALPLILLLRRQVRVDFEVTLTPSSGPSFTVPFARRERAEAFRDAIASLL